MIAPARVRTWELDRTPDLVELVAAARDAGHEVMLVERPMPDAVSVAAIGRAFDIVAAPDGVALEDASGRTVDAERGPERLLAAARLWSRVGPSLDAIAVGGFAYRPDRDPGGAWSGFPALLFRVPALAVVRRRGRTFAYAAADGAEVLEHVGGGLVALLALLGHGDVDDLTDAGGEAGLDGQLVERGFSDGANADFAQGPVGQGDGGEAECVAA